MKNKTLARYSRHILLKEIGGSGQKKLTSKKILVVGLGGLGCPLCLYLVSSGVGTIGIIDGDKIDLTNLNRQIIFSKKKVGKLKVKVAKKFLKKFISEVKIQIFPFMLDKKNSANIISKFDIILDGTDNFETRYIINKSCHKFQKPLISGALGRWEGQLMFFNYKENNICLECVYPPTKKKISIENCEDGGIFSPLSGVIGILMASEALKFIVGSGKNFVNKLFIIDILNNENKSFDIASNDKCKLCNRK